MNINLKKIFISKKKNGIKFLFMFLFIVLFFFIDQYIKSLSLAYPYKYCFTKWLCFELYKHTKFYFGQFNIENWFSVFFFIDLLLFIILIYIINHIVFTKPNLYNIYIILLFSGIASNFYDKYYYKYVVNYLVLILKGTRISCFNLADIYIVLGVIGLCNLKLKMNSLKFV